MTLAGLCRKQRKALVAVTVAMCVGYNLYAVSDVMRKINVECNSKSALSLRGFAFNIDLLNTHQHSSSSSSSAKAEDWDESAADEVESRLDYFGCAEIDRIPNTTEAVAENKKGNRGISFIRVRINNVTIPAVLKKANRNRVEDTPSDVYKYNTAKREIEFLYKLRGHPGIPRIFGTCMTDSSVKYVVERVYGTVMCNDNGTTDNCSEARFLLSQIAKSDRPALAALTLAHTTADLFQLLETRHLLFEDISGINLMVTKRWRLVLVDADSLVFYNNTRMFSKLSCLDDDECFGPMGNLWIGLSLNARIYKSCRDLRGICERQRCRGFDASLHACGMANWYLCKLSRFFERLPRLRAEYDKVCACLAESEPHRRCTFSFAAERWKSLLDSHVAGTVD